MALKRAFDPGVRHAIVRASLFPRALQRDVGRAQALGVTGVLFTWKIIALGGIGVDRVGVGSGGWGGGGSRNMTALIG